MSDLIKREDAIRELERSSVYKWSVEEDQLAHTWAISIIESLPSADAVSREDYHNLLTATDDIDRALREYQAKEENTSTEAEWIPVSERLPKEGQGVLVTVDDNEFDIKVGSCIYSDGIFHSKLYQLKVLAWMPLPTPYKGE